VKRFWWLVPLLVASVLVGGAGCGKKADPRVPREGFTARVENLNGGWEGPFIVLRGDLAGAADPEGAVRRLQGFRVYYGAYDPAEPPCEGCPVRYHGYHEFGPDAATSAPGLAFRIPGKRKDALYFFKVHVIGPEGGLGPASERRRVGPVES
jgi:hypothetical protein